MLHKHLIFSQTISQTIPQTISQIIHQASLIIPHFDYKSKGEVNSVRETICAKIATVGNVHFSRSSGTVVGVFVCSSFASLMRRYFRSGRYTRTTKFMV